MVGSPESIRDRYIAPLVFTGNVESSLAAWEETSGPALMVNPVQDMGEAIAPTSANQCGLAASVLSGSRVASEATAR
jgi:acyl-CoA reductase-like NAD-dependent aldehyde dehydrogenase